jgi:signal peptidase I
MPVEREQPDEYVGEIVPRSRLAATLLCALHPSLAYLYVGRPRASAAAAAVYLGYIGAFIALWGLLGFFPVLPLIVFTLGWFGLAMTCLTGVLRSMGAQTGYVLKVYNHPAIYAVVFLFCALVPLHAGWYVGTEVLFGVVQVNNSSMFPSVIAGDVILIERGGLPEGPKLGTPVVVNDVYDEQKRVRLGRIVATAGDTVGYDGGSIVVNDAPLTRFAYGDSDLQGSLAGEKTLAGEQIPVRMVVEVNGDNRYLIADSGASAERSVDPVVVADDEVFIVGDNRSLAGEPVAVSLRNVVGRPRYILYSAAPKAEVGGDPWSRFGRVGLRLD